MAENTPNKQDEKKPTAADGKNAPAQPKPAEASQPPKAEETKPTPTPLKTTDDKTAAKPPTTAKPSAPKPKEDEKKTRAARPPTGVAKDKPIAEKKEPEAPPIPQSAPRPKEAEKIVYLKLSDLLPFKNHPFQVKNDNEMAAMVDSIKDKGVTQPAIVRLTKDGKYEMVSGHRRQRASELAGFTDMPCIIKDLTDEQAITQMVEDNTTQRENILPSERAKALKMQLDAIKRQGARDGGENVGERSNEIVAKRNNMSVKNVQRFIKLNDLSPDLMKYVDQKVDDIKIGFTTAVELAFITPQNQQYIAIAIEGNQSSPSQSQAQKMRELDKQKMLTPDTIDGIMSEQKKEVEKVIISTQELHQYFGKDKTPREMKDTILKLLEDYSKKQDIKKPAPTQTHEK